MKGVYSKPEMRMVRLKAEEAVLTACKSYDNQGLGAYMPGSDPRYGNCQLPGQGNCNIIGS